MVPALGKSRKGIAWDTLIIWILVLIALVVIFIIVGISGDKMGGLVEKIANIFRFGS